jgi:hypothetical protein
MFMKLYVDQPDNWQPIEEAQVCQELSCYYHNVGDVIECIRQGGKARTPFAFYRWTLTVASGVECAGEALPYVGYFRRGLITANEWARLET